MHRDYKEVIKDLKQLLLSGKYKDPVPFVGAGSSLPLSLPSWQQLVKDYFKYMKIEGDFDTVRRENDDDWPRISDIIYKKSDNNDVYRQFMSERFQPNSCRYTDVHVTIIDLFEKIITTNYDRAFEDVLEYKKTDKNYSIEIQNNFKYNSLVYAENLDPTDFHGRCLAYLHGRRDSNLYVFRGEEYALAYDNDSEIVTFLRSVIKRHPIIFLGFSFDDLIFRNKLKDIILEERNRTESLRKVHGGTFDKNAIAGLYVIMHKSQINNEITKERLNYFFPENLDILDSLIQLEVTQENTYSIKPLKDINGIINNLSKTLQDKKDKFHDLLVAAKKSIDRQKYFDELQIEVIEYTGQHTFISTILKDIVVKNIDFKNEKQLPDIT